MAKKTEAKKVVPKAKLEPEANGHDAAIAASGKTTTKVWTGALMLGPISIPVAMYAAARAESISFNMLHSMCHGQVKQVGYYCPCCVEVEALADFKYQSGHAVLEYSKVIDALPSTTKQADFPPEPPFVQYRKGDIFVAHADDATALALAEKIRRTENTTLVPKDDIVKGYEWAKGNFIVVTKDEIEAQKPSSSSTINIETFVPQADVNPIHFESSYYLAGSAQSKSYSVLRAGLIERKVAAVGKVCMRSSESLVFIFPHPKGGLVAYTAYLADEVRNIEFEQPAEVGEAEKKAVCRFVDAMTAPFEIGKYQDTYRARLTQLIEAKRAGTPVIVEAPKPKPPQSDNLFEMLTISAEMAEKAKKSKAA